MAFRKTDFFRIVKTTVMLQRVWMLSLLVGLYSGFAVWKEYSSFRDFADFPSNIFSIMSLVLSVILVFRTNRAYERWWEGRKLWGQLVNISRNFALKAETLANPDEAERKELQRTLAGFAFALKDHLRDGVKLQDIPGWKDAAESPVHVPAFFSKRMYAQTRAWEKAGRLSPQDLIVLDQDGHDFLNVCGGCERIRNTLIAGSYRSYAIKCLTLYLLALPWGLVDDLHWATIPVTIILSYVMVGLETIADNVEEPFGFDLDDLDLDRLCKTIDVTTAELLEVEPVGEIF